MAFQRFFSILSSGPALNRCSCIGRRASWDPAPWCLGNHLFLPDTPCAWEFSRNAI